ncbi:hypothetical protein [Leptospira sp. B5-022]|uniref:hypothetical protein n=1 Tax=Leptospira sp. B5-022 TaxID=1242992 RepID=UPI0005651EF1|nr:hypothetical protein [Leptospira sp. B5-022]
MYFDNILIAFYIMTGLIASLSTITFLLTFIKEYRDFTIDFSKGIFLKRLKLSNLNIELIPNKIQEFDYGIIKVLSEKYIVVRRRLSSEVISPIGRRVPLVYSTIELVPDGWTAEIRISWVSVILLLYPLLLLGFLSLLPIAALKFYPLAFTFLLIPFGIVYMLFLIIRAEAINRMELIFEEFSDIDY